MLRLRLKFPSRESLRLTIDQEMSRGVMLAKITPPNDLEFRSKLHVELVTSAGSLVFESEVLSVLPGVGVGFLFPSNELVNVQKLLAEIREQGTGDTTHEMVAESGPPPESGAAKTNATSRATFAERVQVALHGTKDDRAAILRDQNRQLHPFVLKSPTVTPEEVASWAANAQLTPEFLKLIADRKEWLTKQAIALALAKNPKTPADVAIRALEYVPQEALRQMAKGTGVLPHVVQAARKKILPR